MTARSSLQRFFASDGSHAPDAAHRVRLPAWLLSIVLHASLALALGLMFRTATIPAPGEPDRPVSIVLARDNPGQNPTYFDDSESESAEPQPAEPSETVTAQSNEASPLPDADDEKSLLTQGVKLPTLSDGPVLAGLEGDSLLPSTKLSEAGRPVILPELGDAEILAADPARNRPPGPSGPVAGMAPFGVQSSGRTFVFLIDRSHSMGDAGLGAIAAAERELVLALNELQPVHRFQIIAYNQRTHYFDEQRMAPATVENKRMAARFLKGIIAAGGTEHQMGLAAALRQKPDAIYVLTDGGEPLLTDVQVQKLAARCAGRTRIHAIHFGSGRLKTEDSFLRRLAELTGGNYGYVDMSQR